MTPGAHVSRAVLAAQALAYHDVYIVVALIVVPALILGFFVRRSQSRAQAHESSPAWRLGRDEGQVTAAR